MPDSGPEVQLLTEVELLADPTSPRDIATWQAQDRRALFDLLYNAFCQAEARSQASVEQLFLIGGQVVRLRFAGDALVPALTRGLAHLRIDPVATGSETPTLTLHLWDSASTGRPLPLLASSLLRLLRITWLEDRGIRGEILDYNDDGLAAALEGYDTDILSLLDLDRGQGIFWTPDWQQLPWYEAGAPLRTLLSWWFASQGLYVVHGGAVGLPDGGLLLAGYGGSGKSTAALACLDSELRYAGDDYCLVQVAAGQAPLVYSLYNTAKVKSSDDFARFPWMSNGIANPGRGDQKPMVFLQEHRPDRLIPGFPLKAIVFPRYIPHLEHPKIIPVSTASALKVLAESTILQLTGSGRRSLKALSTLTRQAPCYLLGVTAEVERIPPALSALLAQHLP